MEPKEESSQNILGCPSETSLAGRASVCEGCPGQMLCQSQGLVDPDQEYIDIRMKPIKHKILVLSGKGGVGKSTVAALLSQTLARKHKVGVVDLDICGPSMSKLMGVESQEIINTQYGWKPLSSNHNGIKVMSVASMLQSKESSVIFRGPRKTGLIKRFLKDTFWGQLDYLICDTPPGTSDEHLTVVKILKSTNPDGAVIVTTPQQVALATIRKEINFCRKMRLPIIGLLENMSSFVCPCCEEVNEIFSSGGVEKLADEYGIAFLGTLPFDPRFTRCCEEGSNPVELFPDSPSIQKLANLISQIERRIDTP
ncbi:hypothetical protein ACJMK2_043332 [Sinanodonta woodiana]|uniref:AAA+ ATPase domain-containing protein n=1 Tax=Sinanodonta woodiana TaxID=1069815 RepID=A0ABD3VXX6_SINWO